MENVTVAVNPKGSVLLFKGFKVLAGFPTLRFVARVEHSRQTKPQPVIRLHSQLSDVLQPDGGALSWRQTAHTQSEYIWTLLTLLQQEGLLTGAQRIIILLTSLKRQTTHVSNPHCVIQVL